MKQMIRIAQLVRRYFLLWAKLTVNSFISALATRTSAALFFLGKTLRVVLFLVFMTTLFTKSSTFASFTVYQAMFFFLSFTIMDTITQLFFREVYRFRSLIVTGDFDLVLVKPMSPLFRALAGGADPLDLIMLVPYVGALMYVAFHVGPVSLLGIFFYLILFANGFLIATGFHILILALAVMTTEIDHAVMIYRDVTSMGRFPVDIYHEPLRSIITFVVPVGVMMTFPVKVMLGLLSISFILVSLGLGMVFFIISVRIWNWALLRYTSASS